MSLLCVGGKATLKLHELECKRFVVLALGFFLGKICIPSKFATAILPENSHI